MTALFARNIGVESATGLLVNDVSLALERGECFTILGESGSGKSLLAQAIMGDLPHGLSASGSVELFGAVTRASDAGSRRPLWGRTLSLLPQEPWLALDPTMRAREQVAEVHALVKGDSWRAARRAADHALSAAGLTAAAARAYPHMLSGGMTQRVALAATRAGGAPLLIVDEPTKGLDAGLRDNVLIDLQRIVESGGSVLIITHDVHVARVMRGKVAVMLAGEFVESGSAAQVLEHPQHPYTRALLDSDPSQWPTAPHSHPDSVILTATGLAKSYGGRRIFADVNLTIGRGERFGVTGPSGSGKTTLGNVLLGLRRADTGTVTRAAGLKPTAFQKLYQDPIAAFPPTVTLRKALDDLLRLHRLDWARVDHMMQILRLEPGLLDRLPAQVSGGELQRFAVVRVLLLQPALIFADEPTSRLDPISQKQTFGLLMESVATTGCALMVVTHNLDIARAVGGRVVQMDAAGVSVA